MLVQSTVKHCWISKAKFENEKMKLKKKKQLKIHLRGLWQLHK